MIEEYQQVVNGFHPQQNLANSPQVLISHLYIFITFDIVVVNSLKFTLAKCVVYQIYETLEHRLVVAEAAQRLRLPIISKDGEIHEEDIEKWSVMSRSSLDSTSTSLTINSSSNSANYTGSVANSTVGVTSTAPLGATESAEPGVGGLPNRFLGVTHAYLWQVQLQQPPASTVGFHLLIYCFRLDPYNFI